MFFAFCGVFNVVIVFDTHPHSATMHAHVLREVEAVGVHKLSEVENEFRSKCVSYVCGVFVIFNQIGCYGIRLLNFSKKLFMNFKASLEYGRCVLFNATIPAQVLVDKDADEYTTEANECGFHDEP
jgi:hypothetical protein